MSRRRNDRALRRAVADLARLHPDDVQAILAALAPDEKARIEALVAGAPDPDRAEEAPVWAYESVSPWLLLRIDPNAKGAGRAGRDFVLMTDAGRDALQAAALPFRTKANGAGGRGRTLLDQAWHALTGGRA